MPSLNEKIAASLEKLHEIGADQVSVLKSASLSRTHLDRLIEHGYLEQIMPGWVMVVDPAARRGTSTPYFANFWTFLGLYCNDRFGQDWVADAQTSIKLLSGERTAPRQVIVISSKGNNQNQNFLFNTSLFSMRGVLPPAVEQEGIRVLPLGEALVQVAPSFFEQDRPAALAALASLTTPGDVIAPLLRGGHSVIAGRLAAAFRSIGRTDVANEIGSAMKAGGHKISEADNPLGGGLPEGLAFKRRTSPVAARIKTLWAELRQGILGAFEQEPTTIEDTNAYLEQVDERYVADAYHSLSIEGYRVTPELIEKIRLGEWNPTLSDGDCSQRDALAAKGYADCFKAVRQGVSEVLDGADPAQLVFDRHMGWFREMFQPSVAAGLFQADRLAGYRRHFIYLDGSRYVPVAHASVQDAMDAYFECLEQEQDSRVRAILGHFVFTYIHPLPDGNGRLGRFIMNLMLASGGYPWTVVPVDERARYMAGLDSASLDRDIVPFASLVADLVRREPPPPHRRQKGEEPEYRDLASDPRP